MSDNPTSDSITEQAARVLWDEFEKTSGREPYSWDYLTERATTGDGDYAAVRESWLASARALADAGLLAHQAPATEDAEITESVARLVEWMREWHLDGEYWRVLHADLDAVLAVAQRGAAPATEDEAATFTAELVTMSKAEPDDDCEGDHDGCCDPSVTLLPTGHMRLTFLVTDGTRPSFGEYRITREVSL